MVASTKPQKVTPAHEYANIFALHEGPPLWELADSIERNGQREPIVLLNGQIIDGRRRELACIKKGIDPAYRQFGSRQSDGDDPLEFVIDVNLHRRHLGEGELALAAAKYATAKAGQPQKESAQVAQISPTNATAAEKFKISESAVRRGKAVLANGTPKVKDALAKVQDKAVDSVRNGHAKSATAAAREPGDDTESEAVAEIVDAEGERVPDQAIDAFAKAKELSAICREIDALISRVEDISKGPGGRLIRFDSFRQQLKDAKGNLWANRATHVCPYCHGKKKACECCNGDGWTAKHIWHAAPGNNEKAKR